MEAIRGYLPKFQIPSLAQLRDGSFLSKAVKKYEDEAHHSVIRDFENKLIRVQEVAVWSNPTVSVVWVVVSQIILYYLCNWTTSLLSSLSYLLLSVYVYLTWVYTVWPAVRVPPSADEDTEHFTPLHPDVLSAPELQTFLHNLKSRIVRGLTLLREEQPGKFCVVMCLVFMTSAGVGLKFSTPVLLHSSVLMVLVVPGILIRLNRNASLAPVITFISEFLSSIVELLVYRGLNAPARDHSKYLEEFEPEHTEENVSLLDRALGWTEKQDKQDEDLSLLGNVTLPSHDEVENDNLNGLLEFEKDLQPPAALTVESNLGTYSDSESEEDVNQVSGQIRDYNDSDTDSLELDPELLRGGVVGTVTSSVTGASSSLSSVLGSFISSRINSQDRRHSGAEDFEFISQDDLELADQDGF